jgi:glycosyltransferase involved in cell wall biosynthesis
MTARRLPVPATSKSIEVLYVHHAGAFGGASRSLLELIEGFPAGSVVARLVTQRGSVGTAFRERGIEVVESAGVSRFDHTSFSHYRGRRWLLLAREAFYLPFTIAALLRARRRWRAIDVVHVNEIVALPAIMLAKWLMRRPVVVHVRSVQQARVPSLRSRFVTWVLRCYADAVIAIDETVRRSLPDHIAAEVIHNAYTAHAQSGSAGSEIQVLPPRKPGILRVAMVGNSLAFKGVREFVAAARLCRERGLSVEFVLVGVGAGNRTGLLKQLLKAAGFVHDVADELHGAIARNGLEDCVSLIPFTQDIDRVYANVDVLCFPSHLDAVGRPVIEAAFWKVPSIVAVRDPQPDTLIDGETGLRIEPADPHAIAEAVAYFIRNPSELARMGAAARELALSNFDACRNAARVLEIYQHVLGASRSVR